MQLVVGAGSIGSTIARQLAERGERVRLVTRGGSGPEHANIERVAADASDAATLTRLARGAMVVYNCANPPYHSWPTDWPPLANAMLAAAESAGAVLAITGNLYGYGPVDRPMTADMPLAARTVKGRVRVKMWTDALDAHRSGRIKGVVEARGSDYIGPKNTLMELVLPALRAGKTAWLPGRLDMPHTFTYTGDEATALVTLAADERAWGRAWHVPSPAPLTLRQMTERLAAAGGYAKPTVRQYPDLVVRAAGLFDKFAKASIEMSYQFKRPFVLDAADTEATFGLRATDLDEALRETLRAADAGPAPQRPQPQRA